MGGQHEVRKFVAFTDAAGMIKVLSMLIFMVLTIRGYYRTSQQNKIMQLDLLLFTIKASANQNAILIFAFQKILGKHFELFGSLVNYGQKQ